MIQKLKALWASLPHQLQAGIVCFVSAAGVTAMHAFEDGGFVWTGAALKHLAGTAVVAGIVALRAFYMLPSKQAAK